MSKGLIEEIIKDGLDYKYYLNNKQHFQNCGATMTPFSNEFPPLLLECGHFISEEGYAWSERRCPICNLIKNAKIKNYTKLFTLEKILKQQEIITDQEKTYNFVVLLTNSHGIALNKIPDSLTFKELFSKIPEFESYEKALAYRMILYINNVGTHFEDLEQMYIRDYNQYVRGVKRKSNGCLVESSKRANMISFMDRLAGGKETNKQL